MATGGGFWVALRALIEGACDLIGRSPEELSMFLVDYDHETGIISAANR